MMTPHDIGTIRAMMTADHHEIAGLLDDLVAAFDCGDAHIAAAAYKTFEARLDAHLRMEEALMLPALRRVDSDEAAGLAWEHRMIRQKLDELGIGVELHSTRATAIRELADALRAHAKREDELLYRWADRAFDLPMLREHLDRAFIPRGRSPSPPAP